MDYYKRALALREETVTLRRSLHKNPEVGLELPVTKALVMEKLTEYGLSPKPCGHGVTAILGSGGKCVLLRADMDALPMAEESDQPFAATGGAAAHTCGHDLHTAMLLTAAKMLKENEAQLEGRVKFMFQPGEETLNGGLDMLENGILEDPKPDGALAFHVAAGKMAPGVFLYNNADTMMFSVDSFRITVTGRGGHGAYPHRAVNPIPIAAQICLALEGLISRETDPQMACGLTLGRISAGTATNIIPEQAVMEGSVRTNDPASQKKLVDRLREVAMGIAAVHGGKAEVSWLSRVPALICDPQLTDDFVEYLSHMGVPGAKFQAGIRASASEDFACIAQRIPAAYIYLSAGFPDHRGDALAHNPRVLFHEDVCPIGAAGYAHCATQWLKHHR